MAVKPRVAGRRGLRTRVTPRGAVFLAVLALTAPARADFFRWTDAEGNQHVTTEPPPTNAGKIKKSESRHASKQGTPTKTTGNVLNDAGVLTGPGAVNTFPVKLGGSKTDRPLDNLQPKGGLSVEIYSAAWCGWCTKTKAYFQSQGVSYREYDIDRDAAAHARLKSLNPGGGIPVTVINGQTIRGYNPSAFDAALQNK